MRGMNISTKMGHGATQLVSNWVRKCWKHVTTSEIQCLGISKHLHDLYHSVAHLSTKPGFLVIYDQGWCSRRVLNFESQDQTFSMTT